MNTIHNTRAARAARAIAARLNSQSTVTLSVPSRNAECKIFRIMCYMNRYCGTYTLEYLKDGKHAIVRKLG